MAAVRGVLLDESFIVSEDGDGDITFLPGAETLLRRLQYSNLKVGISYGESISAQKAAFLKSTTTLFSFDSIMFSPSCIDDTLNKVMLSWGGTDGKYFYGTCKQGVDIHPKTGNTNWTIVLKGYTRASPGKLFIEKIEELPLAICRFNKSIKDISVVTIGYVMKPSREQDFAKRGALPLYPTQNGLMFIPLTLGLPLKSQIQEVDVVLHKATDEIISIDPSFFSCSTGIIFSEGMQELQRYTEDNPDCCMIDPVSNIYPLLDRFRIQQILLGLEDIKTESHCRIRGPHFLQVDNFSEPNLAERLAQAKLFFPNIVKPQVACGVPDAHHMAIIFQTEDFKDLKVPLPAVVQEYVDHGSFIFKFYVLGEKVFYAVRKSTPNASVLSCSSEKNRSGPIIFDSLKSLPTAKDDRSLRSSIYSDPDKQLLDVSLVTNAAHWLRRKLNLTIFGFDVVIHEGTGDHVIVDVNYLPSFKEVPDEVAIPAFWNALKDAYETWKSK